MATSSDSLFDPDTRYKIGNALSPDFVAVGGQAHSAIYVLHPEEENTSTQLSSQCTFRANKISYAVQLWKIKHIGGDLYIFENVAAPGCYASVSAHVNRAPLVCSPNPTIWSVESLGDNKYSIKTVGGEHVWIIPNTQDFVQVSLNPSSTCRRERHGQWIITAA